MGRTNFRIRRLHLSRLLRVQEERHRLPPIIRAFGCDMKSSLKNALLLFATLAPGLLVGGDALPWNTLNSGHDVIGQLGVRLGKIVEIEAKVISGYSINGKTMGIEYLLQVESVAGVPLKDGPIIEFQTNTWDNVPLANDGFALYELRTGKKAERLTSKQKAELEVGYVGSRRKLLVYEEGRFCGVPEQLPEDDLPWQDHWGAFGFRTYLWVLKQLAVVVDAPKNLPDPRSPSVTPPAKEGGAPSVAVSLGR